ncbi:hypothetical protein BofuT4_P034280.1 [Botrytis cinerea T4]|uniref:Uncharacterized protein n=1 Tax=Botryotinia fuckeliana (strain T4) TaxID=999810 RepID=G2Y858_BOTF4|nr:hypothetical protein BofuT4_P034280.1 [Botrytis cinerea T4]
MHCKLYHPCRVYFATNDVNPSDCCSSTFIGDPNLQKRLQDLSASDSEYISRSVPWKHRGYFEPRRLLIQPRILSLTFRVSHGGIVKEWSFLYIWIARQFLPYKVLSVLTA